MSSPLSSASSIWAIIGLWRRSSTGIIAAPLDSEHPNYTQSVSPERENDYSESSRIRRGKTSPAGPRSTWSACVVSGVSPGLTSRSAAPLSSASKGRAAAGYTRLEVPTERITSAPRGFRSRVFRFGRQHLPEPHHAWTERSPARRTYGRRLTFIVVLDIHVLHRALGAADVAVQFDYVAVARPLV